MLCAAAHDLVVMSDSDMRVEPELLRTIAAEFQDPKLGSRPVRTARVRGPSFGRAWKRPA